MREPPTRACAYRASDAMSVSGTSINACSRGLASMREPLTRACAYRASSLGNVAVTMAGIPSSARRTS